MLSSQVDYLAAVFSDLSYFLACWVSSDFFAIGSAYSRVFWRLWCRVVARRSKLVLIFCILAILSAVYVFLEHVFAFGQRHQNKLLCVEARYLLVLLCKLINDIIGKPVKWLVDLWSLGIRNLDFHLFLFEDHSVPKHFYCQVFVKIRICPFRIFSSYVFWNVRRAVAFGQ